MKTKNIIQILASILGCLVIMVIESHEVTLENIVSLFSAPLAIAALYWAKEQNQRASCITGLIIALAMITGGVLTDGFSNYFRGTVIISCGVSFVLWQILEIATKLLVSKQVLTDESDLLDQAKAQALAIFGTHPNPDDWIGQVAQNPALSQQLLTLLDYMKMIADEDGRKYTPRLTEVMDVIKDFYGELMQNGPIEHKKLIKAIHMQGSGDGNHNLRAGLHFCMTMLSAMN